MQNIFTNIKCSEIILYNANENWYIILYDLFSRLCYIATCGPFCKDATHLENRIAETSNVFESLVIEAWQKNCKYNKFVIGSINRIPSYSTTDLKTLTE